MAKKGKGNYFKVYRPLLEDDLWLAEPFTRGQAWIDLIGLANYDRTETFYRGELQVVERGQIKTSCVWLSKRWKWSRNRVIRFLAQLTALRMIQVNGTNNGTTITIENYALYQDKGTAKGTTRGTAIDTSADTSADTQKKNNKEIKNKRGKVIKSEIIDGFLIETDEFGREYAEKVEVH